MTNRRDFLMQAGAIGMAGMTSPLPARADPVAGSADWAAMEREMAALYTVDRGIINSDAAYYVAMTHPVEAAYREKIEWVRLTARNR